jgi:hypothetical protein
MVRQSKVKEGRPERERGSPDLGRNRLFTVAAQWSSGEKFCQPGGAIASGAGGEMARREWGLNRHRRGKLLLPESMGFNRGGENARSDHGER